MSNKLSSTISATDLEYKYGRCISPKELAKFLGLDVRTLIKYASIWGGVEVFPGTWRFFENRIKEVLNAKFDKETWKEPLPSERDGQRKSKRKVVSGFHQTIISGSGNLGKRNKGKPEKGAITDKFGLFNGDDDLGGAVAPARRDDAARDRFS